MLWNHDLDMRKDEPTIIPAAPSVAAIDEHLLLCDNEKKANR